MQMVDKIFFDPISKGLKFFSKNTSQQIDNTSFVLTMPSGTFSLGSIAVVTISGTAMQVTLPNPGRYLIFANIILVPGANTGEAKWQLYTPHNTTPLVSSTIGVYSTGTFASGATLQTIYTSDAANRIVQVRARNDSGLGSASINSAGPGSEAQTSQIGYVKLL